jgi:hypothetical protein
MGQGDPGDLITKQIDLAFCCDVMKRRKNQSGNWDRPTWSCAGRIQVVIFALHSTASFNNDVNSR